MSTKTTYENFSPYKDKVFVTDLHRGLMLTNGGVILPDDNMTNHGVHSRWAKIYSIGPEVKNITPGEWVLIEHGRWSPRLRITLDDGSPLDLWMIEYPKAVLVVSDTDPREEKAIAAPELHN